MRPKLFIASSSNEGSKLIAEELKVQLNSVADIFCWFDHNVFKNGRHTLNELLHFSKECDMGIFIFNTDDPICFKGNNFFCTRDNVIFEYGLFVSSVGTEYSFLFCPENNPDFHLPEDFKGLTYITFDATRDFPGSLIEGIGQIKKKIKKWEIDKAAGFKNYYFEKFYKEEEPPLIDGRPIDFNRSFNLLLYMFGKETFKEFRALDLAFNRWDEASKEEINKKDQGQITNYSKEILKSVRNLFIDGRCTNFRRILVISKLSFSTSEDHDVLKIIHEEENKAVAKRKEIRGKENGGKDSLPEILETRILFVEPGEHALTFKNDNDYALFSGDIEEFAIVETTLKSARTYEGDPNCIILTDHAKLAQRKRNFDNLWNNDTISIEDFLKKNFQKDKSDTVFTAFNEFSNYYSSSLGLMEYACVFVEMAYVDLTKAGDKRRRAHFERACELLNSLDSVTSLRKNIYLGSFINDFKPKKIANVECIEFCEIDKLSDPDNFRRLKMEVSEELKNRNSSFNINTNPIATFYMTNTRTATSKTEKTILANPLKNQWLKFKKRSDGCEDLFVITKNKKEISVGYKKDKLLIPNCAMLMAEHYYELFKFVYTRSSFLKDFWIFDFLLRNEEQAVKEGIEVASVLFDWPHGVTLNVVNCSYFDEGEGSIRRNGPYKF